MMMRHLLTSVLLVHVADVSRRQRCLLLVEMDCSVAAGRSLLCMRSGLFVEAAKSVRHHSSKRV